MMSKSHCSMCDVTFTSDTHAESHYTGKKHSKKAHFISRQKQTADGRSQYDYYDGGVTPPNGVSPSRPNATGHLYYCDACSKNFSGPAPMKQHMESITHERQMRRVQGASRINAHDDLTRDNNENVLPPPSKHYHPVQDDSFRGSCQGRDNAIFNVDENHSKGAARFQTSSDAGSATPPMDSQAPSKSFKGSRKPFSGDMKMLSEMLIQKCKERLEEEMAFVIPFIAESVVGAVLDILSEDQSSRKDSDECHDKSPDSDAEDAIVPCQQADESFTEPNGGTTTNADMEEATSTHDQSSTSSSVEEAISDPQIKQDHFDIDNKPESSSEIMEHPKQIRAEHSGGQNNLDNGANVSQHFQGIYQMRNPMNIEGHSQNIVEVYGVQMHSESESSEMQPMVDMLKRDQEMEFIGEESSKEQFSSVTSQDLIDLKELSICAKDQSYIPQHGLDGNFAGCVNPVNTGELTDMLNVMGEIIQELGSQAGEANEVMHSNGQHGEIAD